ncbi:MAG TPA: SMI1/KNR4 family protein [Blastocatellia bacterium]|nr:SMI1/KNR4 family protein [Blastocatellia bacterium]
MKLDFESIKTDLERLRSAKKRPNVFGAESHGFQLNPPLPESAVIKFEKRHNILLPADYRRFLIELGNGGAGPYYGLFKLGEMDDSFDHARWKENDGFVGDLSEPFPHTAPWNDLTGEPECDEENEEEYDRQWNIFEKRYWNAANVDGAIPVCHLGCAYRQWLVITGPEAGNIWCDDRTDLKGLHPLSAKGKRRVTFYEWYRGWLDEAIQKLDIRKRRR